MRSGYSGYRINGVKDIASPAFKQRPNVVLIHAGTNDLDSTNPKDISDAPSNMRGLIQAVVDNCPDVLVLVAQIVPRKDPAKDKLTVDFNNALPGIVKSFTDEKKHVMVVDMHKAVSVNDLSSDGKHPKPQGYQKMADAWRDALITADGMGWIKSAPAEDRKGTCQTMPSWSEQQGGMFKEYNPGQNIWEGTVCKDDPKDKNKCTCTFGTGISAGTESVPKSGPTCSGMSSSKSAVRFADLSGDGRAEYLWVAEDGSATAYLNQRAPDTTEPAYKNMPNPRNALMHWNSQAVVTPKADGVRRENVLFIDINGDGRADYLHVHPNASVSAWLNTGSSDHYGPNAAKVDWRPLGLIFLSKGDQAGAGVRFADLNSDGLPEYIHVASNGEVTAYLNKGPDSKDSYQWEDAGVVLASSKTDAFIDINLVHFADINGNGRADYLEVYEQHGGVNARMNLGTDPIKNNRAQVKWADTSVAGLGVGQTGQGVQFADMNADGRAEYLVVSKEDSSVRGWMNAC